MDIREDSALLRASNGLWLATLSLMTAFMQTSAPANRHLLARRIAANFRMLSDQPCFSAASRCSFSRLGERWARKARLLAPPVGYTRNDWPASAVG